MMEYSSAFGAVHAALDLAAVSDPPIRIWVL